MHSFRASLRGAVALGGMACAFVALAACGSHEEARVDRPARHVLLLVIDTLRADRLGTYGCPRSTSIAIDALARRGLRFDNAIAQSSWTAPSMVSMMTSRYLSGDLLAVPEALPALAEIFREHGFATAAFVTNPLLSPENGFARGFDRFVQRPGRFEDDPELTEWIRSRAGEPTFTYVHLTEPHDPYRPPRGLLKEQRVAVAESARAAYAAEEAERGYGGLEDAIARIEAELARYDGEVRWADRAVHSILSALGGAGELESAAIAIAADHGEGLWTHLDAPPFALKRLEKGEPLAVDTHFQKRHGCLLYHELIRVPLVLCAPSLPRNVAVPELVENVDLAPTLLELAGVAPPASMQGRSLLDALDPALWTKREAFSTTRFGRAIVTAAGEKLIEPTEFGRTAGVQLHLFDLASDPEERCDLAHERPERVRELSARIAAWARGAVDPDAEQLRRDVQQSREALRALGYLGNDGYESEPPSRPSPPPADQED